ncbi:hypothetical protein AHF37_01239 [Paragonimus kellicotti]|nr:hypothetical protein AHF37_01239 [Paragonimus kellicotti]
MPTQIKLVVPLILAMSDYLPRDQPPELENVVVLIEEFFGLLFQLPVYLTKQSLSWLQRYRPIFEMTSQPTKHHSKTEINGIPDHQHFGLEVIKRLRLIDADVAVGVINEIVAVRSIDVALDNKRQEELCAPVVYEVLEPMLESLFCASNLPYVLNLESSIHDLFERALEISRHFYTRMFCIMSGMEKQSEVSADPTIEAQSYWADWFSIIDQSRTSTVEQRADQRLLRFKELERVRQTETSLEATTKLLSQYKRELTESQKAVQQCQDETMRAKQRHQQLEDEVKSWQTLVNKLEEKLEDANQQAYFYVEAARSSKLDSLNQPKENAIDIAADTSSSNVNSKETNTVDDANKKKNTSDKSTSTTERRNIRK